MTRLPANWHEMSLGALWERLNSPTPQRAAKSTIDALMYSLRSGAAVLARDVVRSRLATIAEDQLREMIALLQKRDGRIAPPWSDDDIKKLIRTWSACRAEQ